ncbi:MAG: IPT/TIG domain-containing protein [Candidatus Obscuribacterales bacterium]|jgi:hypothetical protein|nr:IPT/TIG domain-containing protein [Candidatus Obscuribacterales bacterium]
MYSKQIAHYKYSKAARAALLSFLLGVNLLFALQPAIAASQLVIFKSHEYLSKNYQIQNFEDRLSTTANLSSVPLMMSINNGSHELPSFKWFRIMINGQIIASEKDLAGKDSGTKDVSGLLEGNDLQVQIEAAGVPGAALWWTLSTYPIEINWANPTQTMPGQQITLGGNFPKNASQIQVTFNGKSGTVISSTGNTITVQTPNNLDPGVNHVQVRAAGLESNQIAVTLGSKPVPELLGTDCWMAPPGGTINISGRNFSAAGQNKVFFGDVQATVSASSQTTLTVIVPNWPYGPSQLNIPISVESDGVRSANRIPFDIGPMYHGATPSFGTD